MRIVRRNIWLRSGTRGMLVCRNDPAGAGQRGTQNQIPGLPVPSLSREIRDRESGTPLIRLPHVKNMPIAAANMIAVVRQPIMFVTRPLVRVPIKRLLFETSITTINGSVTIAVQRVVYPSPTPGLGIRPDPRRTVNRRSRDQSRPEPVEKFLYRIVFAIHKQILRRISE